MKKTIIFSRISLFVVYFWFGILKIIGTSPANPMVESLQHQTLPFMTFGTFIIFFSIFEMIIGILFIIPKAEKVAIVLFTLHMITTCLPLILLPGMTWQGFLTPTLEGQYIIKNLILIALVMNIGASLKILKK
jgi:hypothetical protein